MKRKIIGIMLTLALCLTLLPTAALAEEADSMPKVQMHHAEVGKSVEYGIVGANESQITKYQWFGEYSNGEQYNIEGATGSTYTPIEWEVANFDYIGLRITVELPGGSTYETSDLTKLYRRAYFSTSYTEVTDEGISVAIRDDVMADHPMLMAAFYEGYKMCGTAIYEGEIQSIEIMEDGNISGVNLIETEIPENATHVKIFLLGDDCEPLCLSLESSKDSNFEKWSER